MSFRNELTRVRLRDNLARAYFGLTNYLSFNISHIDNSDGLNRLLDQIAELEQLTIHSEDITKIETAYGVLQPTWYSQFKTYDYYLRSLNPLVMLFRWLTYGSKLKQSQREILAYIDIYNKVFKLLED